MSLLVGRPERAALLVILVGVTLLALVGCGGVAVGDSDCHQLDAGGRVASCPYRPGPAACSDARWPTRCAQLDEALGRRLDAEARVRVGRPYGRAAAQGAAGAVCPALGSPYVARPGGAWLDGAWYAVGGSALPDGAYGAWVGRRAFPCFGFERGLDGDRARADVVAALPALVGAEQLCCADGPADRDPR